MNELQLKLCDIQGRLFELSAEKKYNSAAFIKAFMTVSYTHLAGALSYGEAEKGYSTQISRDPTGTGNDRNKDGAVWHYQHGGVSPQDGD